MIYVNSNSDVDITIPTGLTVGFNVSVYQYGTGTVTFVESGTSIHHRRERYKTAGQYAGVGVISYKSNEFNLTGDLKK